MFMDNFNGSQCSCMKTTVISLKNQHCLKVKKLSYCVLLKHPVKETHAICK